MSQKAARSMSKTKARMTLSPECFAVHRPQDKYARKNLAAMLGVDVRELGPHVCRLGCAILNMTKANRIAAEKYLVNALRPDQLVEYIDHNRSDETPMPVTRRLTPAELTGTMGGKATSSSAAASSSSAIALHEGKNRMLSQRPT